MVDLPPLDRYDALAASAWIGMVIFGYLIYPTKLVKSAIWVINFTIFFCWVGYFLWKWTYDIEM